MGKNPWVAAALSFLIAGLGQLYVGSILKGIVFILLDAGTSYIYFSENEMVGGILNLIVGVVAIVDAYNSAKKTQIEKPKIEDEVKQPEVRVF